MLDTIISRASLIACLSSSAILACNTDDLLDAVEDESNEAELQWEQQGLELASNQLEPQEFAQFPTLWAPYPRGVSYRCTQGNNDLPSHNLSNTRYGLDFDTPNHGNPEEVVAALAGKVEKVVNHCGANDPTCGGGWGNHVRLSHGGGYYTIYAHLSSVTVKLDDKLGRGQLLGYEGNTGRSSGDHLHFGVHRGDPRADLVAESKPFELHNRDSTAGGGFVDRDSSSHICDLDTGHMYESNNECPVGLDSLAAAKQITNNTTYAGETCSVGDTDYFYLHSQRSGPFSATITPTDQSIFDCHCAILDAAGNELMQGGPEGYVRRDSYNGAEGCACSMSNALANRTYYLKVFTQMPGNYWFHKSIP